MTRGAQLFKLTKKKKGKEEEAAKKAGSSGGGRLLKAPSSYRGRQVAKKKTHTHRREIVPFPFTGEREEERL